jgi:hypothetical protein
VVKVVDQRDTIETVLGSFFAFFDKCWDLFIHQKGSNIDDELLLATDFGFRSDRVDRRRKNIRIESDIELVG